MSNDTDKIILNFREKIKRQQDLLFGICLFYEGIKRTWADSNEVLETNKQAYINIIRRGQDFLSRAEELLQKAEADRTQVGLLQSFVFPPTEGHPMLNGLNDRALRLLNAYEKLFPGRPKERPLSDLELTAIREEALKDF